MTITLVWVQLQLLLSITITLGWKAGKIEKLQIQNISFMYSWSWISSLYCSILEATWAGSPESQLDEIMALEWLVFYLGVTPRTPWRSTPIIQTECMVQVDDTGM